jgi:hypothetical protein
MEFGAYFFKISIIDRLGGTRAMKVFLVACVAAAIVAIVAAVILDQVQEPVDVAFTTSAVRI